MKDDKTALVISLGGESKGGRKPSDGDGDEGYAGATTAGGMAAQAFCEAKDAGDYDGVFAAFKEMLTIADDDEGDEMQPPEGAAMMGA